MVQKEVRKKTKIYSTVAVLFAIVLVSMIYIYGGSPVITGPNGNGPNPTTYPFNQYPLTGGQGSLTADQLAASGMKTFSSIDELKQYISSTTGQNSYYGGPLDSQFFSSKGTLSAERTSGSNVYATSGDSAAYAPSPAATDQSTHSTTNIQVSGVDEADKVKTDGQYIYTSTIKQSPIVYATDVASSTQSASNTIYILKADPKNPQVVSKINLGTDAQPAGLYLSEDGNRLVVLASKYQIYGYGTVSRDSVIATILPYYQADVYTYINVYDVTNKASPVLERNFTASGSYFNSRMIGDFVYAIVSQPAQVYDNKVVLPAVYDGKVGSSVSPTSIYYADTVQPNYYTFTSFFGINILNSTEQPTELTITMGDASAMYVSPDNIYLTYPTWTYGSTGQYTSIYRIAIDGAKLAFQATGNVTGTTINQYSMDESGAYFRIATDSYTMASQSNVYVLNATDLSITGKLEGISPDENLYAARFMGNRCYLVTFKQTDPFFIIDLSNPSAPRIAGELKIPGYSSFLQPYDETHVIGFGMIAQLANGQENQTLKLALFDVSNINNPTQIATYTVQGTYTSSDALYDPKAILFDLQKQLLVIPVSIINYQTTYTLPNGTVTNTYPVLPTVIDKSTGDGSSSSSGYLPIAFSYTNEYWQGAYVFNVNPSAGFTLKGTITHLDTSLFDSNRMLNQTSTYVDTYNNQISRSLYIDNSLYTFSTALVKVNSLSDLTQTGQIKLP